jgi:AraC-like DNA-binding protein
MTGRAEPLSLERIARGGSAFELASREPCAPLRRHVRTLTGYDERTAAPRTRREFPQPWLVLIIEFGSPLRVTMGDHAARNPGGFAAGLGDRFAVTEHLGRHRGVQVDLTPTGARRLFALPMSELAGRIVALRDLFPFEARPLCDRLASAPDWPSRLDLVEQFLIWRILRTRIDTARVDWAVAQIESSGGRVDVGSLARELGHSHKHLIALFHDQVGIPPKLLARLIRFERAMREARSGARIGWADLALAHGYFDQAHLARDVMRFTGLTPTEACTLP